MKIISIIAGIILMVALVFLIVSRQTSEITPIETIPSTRAIITNTAGAPDVVTDPALAAGAMLSNGACEGGDKPLLTHAPMRAEDYTMIIPYGLMIDGHVTPIDHQYFSPADYNSGPDAYPVYAMADATLVNVGTRPSQFGSDEYRLVFSVSCKLFYYYDLVTTLVPDILTAFEAQGGNVVIPITAGQQIGTIGGQTLDFAVWDMDVELDGFVMPEHYAGESWKIHTADPLNYYTDRLKQELLAKYIRTAEPVSGKIDHDIDGTLQGTWFREDAVGYTAYPDPGNYWLTHVSFSPDHIDPTGFIISLGDYEGQATQFAAIGNTPQPRDVTPGTGLVKYSLTQVNYKTADGSYWDRTTLVAPILFSAGTNPQGCLLVQLTDTGALQLEAFPNQSCGLVDGFTDHATTYQR